MCKNLFFSLFYMLILLSSPMLIGEGILRAEEQERSLFFNEWEVLYSAGSPWKTSEWRGNYTVEYTQNFTQFFHAAFLHQFTGQEWGAANTGYRYPSAGFYLQWLDCNHLRIVRKQPVAGEALGYKFGQIASAGLVMHQPFWMHGKWSAHAKMQVGGAYVFDPYYDYWHDVVTMANHWQFLLSMGCFLNREIGYNQELAIGPQLTHMSNSGLAFRNPGINNFSLSVAYRYNSLREKPVCASENACIESDGSLFRPHLYTSFVVGMSRAYYEIKDETHGNITLMGDVMYRLTPTHGLGMGIDYYHSFMADRDDRKDYVGVALKYDHWWSGFVFHVQGGYYLNASHPINYRGATRFYQNVGFKYVFFRNQMVAPYIGLYSKGNNFKAEHMAFSVGVILQ